MRRSIFALFGATTLVAGAAFYAQTHAETEVGAGVNVGSLICTTAEALPAPESQHGLDCLFARSDGVAEPYHADIRRLGTGGVAGGKTPLVWLVFASGAVAPGALAGDFGKADESVRSAGLPEGAILLGGEGDRIALAPARVPGHAGLNVADRVSEVALRRGG